MNFFTIETALASLFDKSSVFWIPYLVLVALMHVIAVKFQYMSVCFIAIGIGVLTPLVSLGCYWSVRIKYQKIEIDMLKERIARDQQFAQLLVHDLRSPLTFLDKIAHHVAVYENLEGICREAFNAVGVCSKQLLVLIDDVSGLLESRSEHFELTLSKVDVGREVRSCAELYSTIASNKGVAIRVICDQQIFLETDHRIFNTIIRNLLDNSVKYTNSGSIEIRVRNVDSCIEVCVADSGIGMDVSLISERLGSGEKTKDDSQERGHLGLKIIACYSQLINARMNIVSTLGMGTQVTLAWEQK